MASTSGLVPPPDTRLPFFSYGLFQPSEIPFRQIAGFVRNWEKAECAGSLVLRDGLPLLDDSIGGHAPGVLLRFNDGDAEGAYSVISRFEPKYLYKWKKSPVRVSEGGKTESANVLVGKRLDMGTVPLEEPGWKSANDPVLNEGLAEVRRLADADGRERFHSVPPEHFDWGRLFRLEMGYLFLWTVLERYVTLTQGPSLEAGEKVKALGEDGSFGAALKPSVERTHQIFDSRDPSDDAWLDPHDPVKSARYYYLVRSNVTHRGKGTFRDGETVRRSLNELLSIVDKLVEEIRSVSELKGEGDRSASEDPDTLGGATPQGSHD